MVSSKQPRISLCMIVKDEEAYIAQCLESVRTLVDEIIVVDTGSTDQTVEIARSYGARTYQHPWEGDFSRHRNQSISYAEGEWILVMDADEIIAAQDLRKIRSMLDSVEAEGFMFTLRNYEADPNLANITLNPGDYEEGRGYPGFIARDLIRLFKNDPDIVFDEPVHEAVTKSFLRAKKVFHNTGIPIHHFGKLRKDRIGHKQKLYLSLGEDRLRTDPDDPMTYKGLADQYLEMGMPDRALDVTEKGLSLFPEMIDLRFNRALALHRMERSEEARIEYCWVLERRPDHFGARHNLAQIYHGNQMPEKTIEILNQGIDLGLRHPALFLLLGQAHEMAGDWDKALINFDHVLEVQADFPNINCHKAVVLLNNKKYDAALEVLEREIEINGNLVFAYHTLGKMSMMLNDRESAAQFFQKVLTIDPSHQEARSYLNHLEQDQSG